MTSPIIKIETLGSAWATIDPFLVCVHHVDNYPRGNDELGPDAPPLGRALGRDMEGVDGWSMYFGQTVPGFPAHPHRGFETITILRKGVVDHSDSLGNSARFGAGDVQWLTAGRGIVHSEMFPLLNKDEPNHLELFQIWLNLPARSKMVEPSVKMLWSEEIPVRHIGDANCLVQVRCIAGLWGPTSDEVPTVPPPNSWAADPTSDLAIWSIKMTPGAKWTLPAASDHRTRRMLYFFAGESMTIGKEHIHSSSAIEIACTEPLPLINGSKTSEILMLQGRPIGEPVVQEGHL